MPSYCYCIPNLTSSNSYDIRSFTILDDKAKEQIKKDLEFIQGAQKNILRSHNRMFKGKSNNTYLAEFPESPEDIEIENQFMIIKGLNEKELQYRYDSFYQINVFCEQNDLYETPKDKLSFSHCSSSQEEQRKNTEKPFTITVNHLTSGVESILIKLEEWFNELAAKCVSLSNEGFFSSKQTKGSVTPLKKLEERTSDSLSTPTVTHT